MPFRLDDVLLVEWGRDHSLWDAWDPVKGQIVNSVRPIFAATVWVLTRTAGTEHLLPWHLILLLSFFVAFVYLSNVARQLSGHESALYLAAPIFFICFVSILNVFFWYSDLTYALELLFTLPCWYYGIRGLREGNIKLWLLSMLFGALAIMSKEPAIVLVHMVLLGIVAVLVKERKIVWKRNNEILVVIGAYAILLVITVFIALSTPTKSNRFFSLFHPPVPGLMFYVQDRIRYYGETLFSLKARVLLFTPILYFAFADRNWFGHLKSLPNFVVKLLVSIALASILLLRPPIALIVLSVAFVILSRQHRHPTLRFLVPFYIAFLIGCLALLVTVQLVRTQLFEMGILASLISAVAWSFVWQDAKEAIDIRYRAKLPYVVVTIIFIGLVASYPSLARKEELLRSVRNVRKNANDAVHWSANNLPQNSTLFVSGYSLFGLKFGEELTAKDDSTKLRTQYTLQQGFIRTYFKILGRSDVHLAYLEDRAWTARILDSARNQGTSYLFIQTKADADYFLNKDRPLVTEHDKRVARFAAPPYPSEIWKLQ